MFIYTLCHEYVSPSIIHFMNIRYALWMKKWQPNMTELWGKYIHRPHCKIPFDPNVPKPRFV